MGVFESTRQGGDTIADTSTTSDRCSAINPTHLTFLPLVAETTLSISIGLADT